MPRHLTHLDAIRGNAVLQQRLAKSVLQCVRNSQLEDLHAGIVHHPLPAIMRTSRSPAHSAQFRGPVSPASMMTK